MDVIYILTGLNQLLASAITILSFSLFVYIIGSLRSAVGFAFSILLALVCFTYAGDVALFRVTNLSDATLWLKFQWIGIAFMPAAYLHFADALLTTTNAISKRRRFTVVLAYTFGAIVFLHVLLTNQMVQNAFHSPGLSQFRAGPFFQVFALYFYTTLSWGTYKVYLARTRCLTSGARRRMTYLAASFVAPALGVFPYMLIANRPSLDNPELLLGLMLFGNIGIAIMILVMAYSVAFFGALSPDRVIKHDLVQFLLAGTAVATVIIIIVQALPQQPKLLGLPRELILNALIVIVLTLSPFIINLFRPWIDWLLFRQDRLEIAWLGELDRRLLTTTDLQQALENMLIILCEMLRVKIGFIYNLNAHQGPRLEAQVGSTKAIEQALVDMDVKALFADKNGTDGYHFIVQNNFWFVILQDKARRQSLGLLGVQSRSLEYDLTDDEQQRANQILAQVEQALEDRFLQQQVFAALKLIISDVERVQRLRQAVPYSGSTELVSHDADPVETNNPIHRKDFSQMVRDALKHYWGGPKLTSSPLLKLSLVKSSLKDNGDNSVRALRSVLTEAIEKQRPDGESHATTTEWLIYNILDMKFLQGMRVRDIANRLAMSESDLYRKQRLAIEEVARTLREMETQENGHSVET